MQKQRLENSHTDQWACPQSNAFPCSETNPRSGDLFLWACFGCQMSVDVVLSRGRAAYVSAAGCRPTPQSQDAALTSISCKKAISLQDSPLKPGNTLRLLVCFCHHGRSAILSRWRWTGRWGRRLGKEWWLIPATHPPRSPLLPSHASGGYRDRML